MKRKVKPGVRLICRDTLTGRFAKHSTCRRSIAQGGKRYRFERWKRKPKPPLPPPRPPAPPPLPAPPPGVLEEWIVVWNYKQSDKRVRELTLHIVAASEGRALELAQKAISEGKDDLGYDLGWAQSLDWTEQEAIQVEPEEREGINGGESVEVQ